MSATTASPTRSTDHTTDDEHERDCGDPSIGGRDWRACSIIPVSVDKHKQRVMRTINRREFATWWNSRNVSRSANTGAIITNGEITLECAPEVACSEAAVQQLDEILSELDYAAILPYEMGARGNDDDDDTTVQVDAADFPVVESYITKRARSQFNVKSVPLRKRLVANVRVLAVEMLNWVKTSVTGDADVRVRRILPKHIMAVRDSCLHADMYKVLGTYVGTDPPARKKRARSTTDEQDTEILESSRRTKRLLRQGVTEMVE